MPLYIYREVNGLNCCSLEVLPIQEGTSWTLEFSQEPSRNTDDVNYSFALRCGHGDNEYIMAEFIVDVSRLSDAQQLHGLRRATAAIMTQLNTNRYVTFDELIQIFLLRQSESACT